MEVLELIGVPPFLFEPLATAIATMAIAHNVNPVIIFLPFFFLIKQSFLPFSAPHGALTPIVFLMSFLLIDTAKLMPLLRFAKHWQVLLRQDGLFLDINQKKGWAERDFFNTFATFCSASPMGRPFRGGG